MIRRPIPHVDRRANFPQCAASVWSNLTCHIAQRIRRVAPVCTTVAPRVHTTNITSIVSFVASRHVHVGDSYRDNVLLTSNNARVDTGRCCCEAVVTPPPIGGRGAEYCDECVCLSVCPSVRVCIGLIASQVRNAAVGRRVQHGARRYRSIDRYLLQSADAGAQQ